MSGERRTFCVTEHLMNTHSATNRYAIQLIEGMVVDVTDDHNRKQLASKLAIRQAFVISDPQST